MFDISPAENIILSLICEYKFDTYEKILLDISTLHQLDSNDFIMDCLYMRYLKNLKKHGPISKILNFSRQMTDKNIKSQYHIAFAFYFNDDYQRKFKEQIIEQLKYNINDEPIKINGIQISDTILYYLNKHMNQFDFTKKYKNINEAKIKSFYNELYSSITNYDRNSITNECQNIKHYYPIEFWQTAIDFNLVDHLSFNVKKNPFLLNAGACLIYLNRLSKINFHIEHFEYPKKVTNEIIKFIFEKYDIDELLEYKTLSIELKNLLSLICMLRIKEVNSFESLLKMRIPPKCLIILTMIYRNYNSSVFTREFAEFVGKNLYTKDSNDFLLMKILFTINPTLKPKEFDSILPDIYWPLYPSLGEFISFSIRESGQYKFLLQSKNKKKDKLDQLIINKGFVRKELKVQNELVEYQIEKQDLTFLNYNKITEDFKQYLKNENYKKVTQFLMKFSDNQQIRKELASEYKNEILILLDKLVKSNLINDALEISKYFNICLLVVSRKNVLADSMNIFEKYVNKIDQIKVYFKGEPGIDLNGLTKEWFTIVSNELSNSDAFIKNPNGSSLTFNPNPNANTNGYIYTFTGQLLAAALNFKKNVNIQLGSYIWKVLSNEKITLDDMKEYDEEIYQSLKWIYENDSSQLSMTFVDSDDKELIKNGRNTQVNEKNKNLFINLMMKRILIDRNRDLLIKVKKGFNQIIDDNIEHKNSKGMKSKVLGRSLINVKEFEQFAHHEQSQVKYFNDFFEVISNWPQNKLRKLLKFITGSSALPIDGFNHFVKIGYPLTIYFIDVGDDYFPTAATCFNNLYVPRYSSKLKLDKKLSMSIECDEFGLS